MSIFIYIIVAAVGLIVCPAIGYYFIRRARRKRRKRHEELAEEILDNEQQSG